MLAVILAYDQLLFRPLVAWSAKFRFELTAGVEAENPWVLKLLRRTRLLAYGLDLLGGVFNAATGLRLARWRRTEAPSRLRAQSRLADIVWGGGARSHRGAGAMGNLDLRRPHAEPGRPGHRAAPGRSTPWCAWWC